MNKPLFILGALLSLAACGGTVVEPAGSGTGAGTTGTGGSPPAQASPCPSSQPTTASCAGVPDGFRCTYGDSVRPDCRAASQCMGGQWSSTTGACSPPTAGVCGNSPPVVGSTCAFMPGVCVYGDTLCNCACNMPFCANTGVWACSGPPSGAGCPATVPNDGTPCDAPGAACTYGDVCGGGGATVTCNDGLWLWNTMPPDCGIGGGAG